MTLKIIGAIIIIGSCGGFGFSQASEHLREERCLQELSAAVEWMMCQLEYQLTPLPQLIRSAGTGGKGEVSALLQTLAERLEQQSEAEPSDCMGAVLCGQSCLPLRTQLILRQLGQSLGRFAMSGQISCLQGVRQMCQRELSALASGREARLRSYRTLGLCAGAALVILFI